MLSSLLKSRRFAPLFWTQFLAALNDSYLKQSFIILVTFGAAFSQSGAGALTQIASAVLIAPYFFLSGLAGELADKYDKAIVAKRVKFAEIFATGLAALGFALQSTSLLLCALAAFGVLGTLFGPIKYGALPEQLTTGELVSGNALVESATFAAIILGTIAGGASSGRTLSAGAVAAIMLAIAIACWLTSRQMPRSHAAAPDIAITANPLRSTGTLLIELWRDKRLFDGVLIVSWFWAVGAVVLGLLPILVKDAMGGDETVATLASLIFAVGIAAGSLLAARASHVRPNLALVPLGGLLISAFCLDTAWGAAHVARIDGLTWSGFLGTFQGWRFIVDFLGLAIGGGLFVVPAFAAVQSWSQEDKRARVIAANNIVNAAFIVSATLGVALLQLAGAGVGALFAALGVGSLLATAFVAYTWGRHGMQELGKLVFKSLFRVEVRGLENLPPIGTNMVIAPNHVSLIDGPLIHSFLPFDAVFAVDTGIAKAWWAKPFMKLIRVYTLDPSNPFATRHLVGIVKSSDPLVIFPEGRVTVTGSLMKVYDGAAMIADKGDAVIVPARIEGAQRSILSYLKPWQVKKSLFPKVTLTFLPPVKLKIDENLRGRARRLAAGAALQDVMTNAFVENAALDRTLFQGLVAAYRNFDHSKPAVEDPLTGGLTYKRLILGAQILARKIMAFTEVGENVGVLLPNANGVAVTLFALESAGRVPAMLNFSAGLGAVASACATAKVKTILTSRAFIEKGRLGALADGLAKTCKLVYLEDVRAGIGFADKLRGVLDGMKPLVARSPNDPAAVLFTSGSEGAPKGVVLSHRNILANAAQALARIDANSADKVFNALPVFHSFGLTGGLMMPLLAGVPVYLYPSPLHYRIIPELVYQTNATILFGTDTFLAGYARSAHPYDFRSLRLVIAGAEAVKARTRETYAARFGLRILEGYGVTETSPVLAMNTPMANKPGTVGRLSPLMEARLDPVPGIDDGGRLVVRGPNVMLGYYRAENPGVLEPPPGGWHDTGDIVAFDAQGFITIKGRAKRFAKIAGEMVSLAASEALAAAVWPQAQSIVVALPDVRKGERLVLMTTEKDAARDALLRQARASGAPELSVPTTILVLDKLPLLGTGKTDYVSALAMAKERVGESVAA